MLSKFLEWLTENRERVWRIFVEYKAWIALALVTLNSLVLVDLLYFRVTFPGLESDWPDAIVCYGKVGTNDGLETRTVYYITHLRHQYQHPDTKELLQVISYRIIGGTATLHFAQDRRQFFYFQDKGSLKSDCENKNLDWIVKHSRGLYFLSNRPWTPRLESPGAASTR